jgi:molybdate-binding protein/DNA-binding XRE family transcriptional regulator
MPESVVHNRVGSMRRSRGIGAAELARRIGVSRQTIYAIEGGSYVPNTEVSLKLARELEVRVDDLFSLPEETRDAPASQKTELLTASPVPQGQAVRLCRVGDHLVSVPMSPWPAFLPDADGVVAGTAKRDTSAHVVISSEISFTEKRLVVAGCDPAIGLLRDVVGHSSVVELVPAAASSRLALRWLKRGKVHVAGTHLKDANTGKFNVPFIRRELPDEDLTIVTFAHWEEGFVTALGNPKRIRNASDLARNNIRIVNRESGAGSRALLDDILAKAGIEAGTLRGYQTVVQGHLAAAYRVYTGEADTCVATRSAAQAFGLDFVPLQRERYDFVMRRSAAELPAVQVMLDILQRASLRRKLEMLAGYDATHSGELLSS